jgi:hypothetical protein
MPVSGRKQELIDRLLGRGPTKVTDWKKSKAKVILSSLIDDENSSVHRMTAEEIHNSHPLFKTYKLEKFKGYLETLQKAAENLRNIVREDEREIWSELIAFPRAEMTIRGYPFWDTHDARDLLEKDVKDGKANRLAPSELRKTREEYKEFPPLVFCRHVQQERRRQREPSGWVVKRNKKARKMLEKEVSEEKNKWEEEKYKNDIKELCAVWEDMRV